jgi:cell division protein FtsB
MTNSLAEINEKMKEMQQKMDNLSKENAILKAHFENLELEAKKRENSVEKVRTVNKLQQIYL